MTGKKSKTNKVMLPSKELEPHRVKNKIRTVSLRFCWLEGSEGVVNKYLYEVSFIPLERVGIGELLRAACRRWKAKSESLKVNFHERLPESLSTVGLLWMLRWKELHDPESWSRCQHQEIAALVQDTVINRNFRYFYISLQLLQMSQKIIIIRTVAHRAPLSTEFSRQENWSW